MIEYIILGGTVAFLCIIIIRKAKRVWDWMKLINRNMNRIIDKLKKLKPEVKE